MAEEKSQEQVLVVPTEVFRSIGDFQGFCPEPQPYLERLFQPGVMSFMNREAAEADPNFKQLIPYCLFRHFPASSEEEVFSYFRRKGKSAESRLLEKLSIGIGGHINPGDDVGISYDAAMLREIREEIDCGDLSAHRCLGLINDDSNEVGRVHLGVVHEFSVEGTAVYARELALGDAMFRCVSVIRQMKPRAENWTSILLDALWPV